MTHTSEVQDMGEISGQFQVKDGHLFFESAGAGSAVVLLHGFGLDSRMWAPQFEAFRPAYRVICYDLRGFGRSSLPSTADYTHEDDLMGLLGELGAAPAHVVGLSMGGRMALRFAAAYPRFVRSLVLADSALDGHIWSAEWDARWKGLCQAAAAGRLEDAKRQWLEHPLFEPARADASRDSVLAGMIEDYTGWHWHNRDTARTPSPPLAEKLHEIRIPSLVITGSRDLPDFQAIANVLAKGLPAVRRLVIEDAGHMVNLEASEEFNAALLEFWRCLSTPPS
jgi:pimeloyl-ACP methyl ester carboxylesterase